MSESGGPSTDGGLEAASARQPDAGAPAPVAAASPRPPTEPGDAGRSALPGLIALRFVLVAMGLTIVTTRRVGQPGFLLALDPPTLVLLGCIPLNFFYWLLLRRFGRPAGDVPRPASPGRELIPAGKPAWGARLFDASDFIRTQSILDVAIVTVLVYLTGGVGSNLIFLYFGPILAASSLLGLPASLLCASVSAIAVSLVTLVHFFASIQGVSLPFVAEAWRPTFPVTARAVPFALLYDPAPGLLTQAVSFYLIAVLSGTLAGRLRQVRMASARILDRLQEGVLTIDAAGRVLFLNRRARELLRVPASEGVVGQPWEEVCPQQLSGPLARAFGRLQAAAREPASPTRAPAGEGADLLSPSVGDNRLDFETSVTPAGTELALPVQVVSSPLTDERGRLRGANVIFIDLSEHKRMEAALRQAERVEALNQAAAGIAHEIRNPIASIRASAQELLAESGVAEASARGTGAGASGGSAAGVRQPDAGAAAPLPQAHGRPTLRERLLRVLLLESDRLNSIVTDFLAYARIRPPAMETVPLAEVLERVALLLEKQASPRHHVSVLCPAEAVVEADREQLVQIFLNLGLNALEAMPEGGTVTFTADSPRRTTAPGGARVGARSEGSVAVVSITDEGPGVAPDRMERIFEPFYTTKARGTGMGLPIVKRIVEALGGRITVANRPGLQGKGGPGTGPAGSRQPADAPARAAGGRSTGAVFRVELPG